jgi:hypothetical protein
VITLGSDERPLTYDNTANKKPCVKAGKCGKRPQAAASRRLEAQPPAPRRAAAAAAVAPALGNETTSVAQETAGGRRVSCVAQASAARVDTSKCFKAAKEGRRKEAERCIELSTY